MLTSTIIVFAKLLVFFLVLPIRQSSFVRGILAITFTLLGVTNEKLYLISTISDNSAIIGFTDCFLIKIIFSTLTGFVLAVPILTFFNLSKIFFSILDKYCIGHEMQFTASINGVQNSLFAHLFENLFLPIVLLNEICLKNIHIIFSNFEMSVSGVGKYFSLYSQLFLSVNYYVVVILLIEFIFALVQKQLNISFTVELYSIKTILIFIMIGCCL